MQSKAYVSCEDKIAYIVSSRIPVCVRGTGKIAQQFLQVLEKALGVKINFFIDGNLSQSKGNSLFGRKIVKPGNIAEKSMACLVLVAGSKQDIFAQEMEEYGYSPVITWRELCQSDFVGSVFRNLDFSQDWAYFENRKNEFGSIKEKNYKVKKTSNNVAIYTCITGQYDLLKEPTSLLPDCDYYVISDKRPSGNAVYKWINIDEIVPEEVSDIVRRSRYCKINAHRIFQNYKYSIYHDGNMYVTGDVLGYIAGTGNVGITLCRHPGNHSIFEEAAMILVSGKDKADVVVPQLNEYLNEGMPKDLPVYACGLLVREHNKPSCIRLMEDWWKEIFVYSYRDQISFPYAMWKNNVSQCDITEIEGNIYGLNEIKNSGKHGNERKTEI